MAYRKLSLIGALAFCLFGSAHAGYAQLAPPPTWSKTATDTLIRVAANDASFPGGIRAGFASFNTGASLVQIPAAYRFAANAGRFAAAAAFGWPAAMLLAGGLAYEWFTDNDFIVEDGMWKKKFVSEGLMVMWWASSNDGPTIQQGPLNASAGGACSSWLSMYEPSTAASTKVFLNVFPNTTSPVGCLFRYTRKSDGYTETFTRALHQKQENQVTTRWDPASRGDLEDGMESKQVPLGVPQAWPLDDPMWWPVQPKPIINPSPEPVPATNPLPVPVPQPMRVPQGEPIQVPNPNYDPVTNPEPYIWRQPVVDLVPSPTADDPWRVDVQPKDIIKTTPEPITDPEPVPDPANDPNATPSEKSDLCADHPEILACAKPELDTPEGEPLDNIEKPISFMPETNWAGGSGFCPAPRHLAGANVDFKFDMVCDFMNGVRPVVLAIAAFVGGMILIGARGGAAE